jgi:hypothetical protein
MGPESSRVKVKDLAQEGLILMTIFEAELSAITFHCAPEQPVPIRQETCPGCWLSARLLRLRDQIYRLQNGTFQRIADRSGAQEEREGDRNVGGLDALRHPVDQRGQHIGPVEIGATRGGRCHTPGSSPGSVMSGCSRSASGLPATGIAARRRERVPRNGDPGAEAAMTGATQ